MAQKKLPDVTPEEFRELMHEIIKRFIFAGILVCLVGLVIVLLMSVWAG